MDICHTFASNLRDAGRILLSLSAMFSLADTLLSLSSYRLPTHLQTYVKGATPLSTDKAVYGALVSYLVIIFSIQAIQKNGHPYKLTTLFQIHNVILSAGSALLLVLMLEEILPIFWKHGIFYAVCSESAWTSVSLPFATRLLFLTAPLTSRDSNSTT